MPSLILVADDSMTIQRVVEMTLAREDTRVINARNADEALAAARRERPDLVLADSAMPGGKSGYDLASAIRADVALRGVPVLILASNFNPYEENRGRAAGVAGHVSKPFETQALIDRVKEILGASAP